MCGFLLYNSDLPEVIRFTYQINQLFNSQITLAEAQTITIRELLQGRPRLLARFGVVCGVWNHVRGRVTRFECEAVEVPTISLDVCNLVLC